MDAIGSKGIIRGALTLFASKGMARILRYLLWVVIIFTFGYSEASDAYFIVQTVTLLFLTLTDNVFNYTLIPVLSKERIDHGEDEAHELANSSLVYINLLLFCISLAIFILADTLSVALAPGLSPEWQKNLSLFFRIISPIPVLSGLGAVPACVFYSERRFTLPSVTFLFYGISSIVSALFFASLMGIKCIFMGAVFGVFLQAVVLIVVLMKEGKISFSFKRHKSLPMVFKLTGPGLLSSVLASLNPMVDKLLATTLGAGAVTTLIGAIRFGQLPYVLLVSPLGSSMPHLSEMSAAEDFDGMRSFVRRIFGLLAFIIFPAMVFLFLLREPLIGVLIEYGKVKPEDTLATADAFFFIIFGLFFLALNGFTRSVFFALRNAKIPLLVTALGCGMNLGFDLLFMQWMGLNGIALAKPCLTGINALILFWLLQKKIGVLDWKGIIYESVIRIAAAALTAGGIVHLIMVYGPEIWGQSRLLVVVAGILAGVCVYLLFCAILGVREIKEIAALITRKLARRKGPKP